MQQFFGALLCGSLIAGTAAAQAPVSQPPVSQTPVFSTVIAGLETRGYRILDAEAEGGWFEIEAITAAGQRVELLVEGGSGAIRHERPED